MQTEVKVTSEHPIKITRKEGPDGCRIHIEMPTSGIVIEDDLRRAWPVAGSAVIILSEEEFLRGLASLPPPLAFPKPKRVTRRKKDQVIDPKEIKRWYKEFKARQVCANCGTSYPDIICFHHRDLSTKVSSISKMIDGYYTKEQILEEVAKCIPLCLRCHGRKHWRKRVPVK